jgi:hypothetical protein
MCAEIALRRYVETMIRIVVRMPRAVLALPPSISKESFSSSGDVGHKRVYAAAIIVLRSTFSTLLC